MPNDNQKNRKQNKMIKLNPQNKNLEIVGAQKGSLTLHPIDN